MIQSINAALEEMKQQPRRQKEYVKDWRNMIPKGSRWFPGCPGNPSCKDCDGMGYVRLDVPVSHKYFGKIFLCTCVDEINAARARQR
jgi:hypothetical protein